MDLSVRDAARLLAVSEDTVYRLIRNKSLPAHRVHHQVRLNRVELQEWAATHGHRVSPELFSPEGAPAETPSLLAALERGGIHAHVPGERREDVLAALTQLPGIPEHVDRAMLHQLLLARESLASTSIGNGIALPHPRDPLILRLREPRVLLCFLEHPVDFGAPDGQPVHSLFLLLSPSVRAHLQLLARLAYALHDGELVRRLHAHDSPEAILDRIRKIEEGEGPAAI
jgi:nitrogen PTS system EIIA component